MKINKMRLFVINALALTFILLFAANPLWAGGSQENEEQPEEPIVISLGGVWNVENFQSQADMKYAKAIEEKTNGRIKVNYFPAGQLGSEREMVEMVKLGSLELYSTGPGTLASYYPPLAMLELGYLTTNDKEYHAVIDAEWTQNAVEELRKKTGIRILGWKDAVARQLNTKFPVTTPDQIKGIKIRVSEVPARVALWKALGTNPAPIAYSELYVALATGVVDAQENPCVNILSAKLYEQAPYVAFTSHLREYMVRITNDKWFSSLPRDLQEAIIEAEKEDTEYRNSQSNLQEEKAKQALIDLGVEMTYPDVSLFAELAKDVYKDFLGDFSEEDWLTLQAEIKK